MPNLFLLKVKLGDLLDTILIQNRLSVPQLHNLGHTNVEGVVAF